MIFVKMGESPAVGPRVGLVPAADVLLFHGNPPGGAVRTRLPTNLHGSPKIGNRIKIRFSPPVDLTRIWHRTDSIENRSTVHV